MEFGSHGVAFERVSTFDECETSNRVEEMPTSK